MKVRVVRSPDRACDPATGVPPTDRARVWPVPIASLNVTDTVVPASTPVASGAGVRPAMPSGVLPPSSTSTK